MAIALRGPRLVSLALSTLLLIGASANVASATAAEGDVIEHLPDEPDFDVTCGLEDFVAARVLDDFLDRRGLAPVTRVDEPVRGETGITRLGIVMAAKQASAEVSRAGLKGEEAQRRLAELINEVIDRDLKLAGKPEYRGGRFEHADAFGNVAQLWCLKKGNGHGGPDFAVYFTGNGVRGWIAGCLFAGGLNRWSFERHPTNRKMWKIRWTTRSPNSDRGWAFTYDVGANKLRIDKLKVSEVGGKIKLESLGSDTMEPPAEFKNIKFDGVQITLDDAPGRLTRPIGVAAAAMPGIEYDVGLFALTNDSTLLGAEAVVDPGARITVVKDGVRFARVTERAAGLGWSLAGWTSDSATFQYDGAEPLPINAFAGLSGLIVETSTPTHPPPGEQLADVTDEEIEAMAAGMSPLPDPLLAVTVTTEFAPELFATELFADLLAVRIPEPPVERPV